MTTATVTPAQAAADLLAIPRTAVLARDMLTAQGYRITADHRAELVAVAEQMRLILGTDARQTVSIAVMSCYDPSVRIGSLVVAGL